MIRILFTGFFPDSKDAAATFRELAICVGALIACGFSPVLFAQEIPPVVLESIALGERDMQKPTGAEIASAQEAFRESRDTNPARAPEIAADLVALVRKAFGESHANYARALTNVAILQAERGQFEAAVENYIGAIRAHERASRSISSNDLINPLHGLAGAYMALGEVERAVPVFLRSQNIIERAIPVFLRVQETGTAEPEFIELTEAVRETPAGAEFAHAQEAFRVNRRADPKRALERAKELVVLASVAFGESPEHTARALTNLAIVQAENANFSAAIDNYVAAISAHERASGTPVSKTLINPLLGLASAYMSADQAERAIPVFERAIHISHVNDGPNNLDQVEIIDALSRAYYLTGDRESAGDMRELITRLFDRRPEDEPAQLVDALARRARWSARLGDYDEATRSYQRLEQAISEQYGANDVRLIEPLAALANTALRARRLEDRDVSLRLPGVMVASTVYSEIDETVSAERLQRIRNQTGVSEAAFSEGNRAMQRAVQIARDHAAEDPARLARTLVKQGDWLASLNQAQYSLLPYREAWNILDADPALHGLRDQLFGAPAPVVRVTLRPVYVARASDPDNPELYEQHGYADIAYDVDAEGKPVNVRVVAADPAGLMDTHLTQQMRRFRFRPAISDGKPRAFSGLTYRHTFHYDASRLTEGEQEIISTTTYEDATAAPPGAPEDQAAPERSEARVGSNASAQLAPGLSLRGGPYSSAPAEFVSDASPSSGSSSSSP